MSGPAARPPGGGAPAGAGGTALIAGVVLATLAAVLAGTGALAAVPALAAGAAWLVVRTPPHRTAALLLFLLLALEDTGETMGQWRSPVAVLGDLLHSRLDLVTSLHGVAVTGMEVAVAGLLAAWAFRRRGGAEAAAGRVASPRALRGLVLVYVAGVALAMAHGMLRGQGPVPWKVRNLVHPILLFVLFEATLRGPRDHGLVGRLVVLAGVLRAAQAVVVQRIAVAETGGKFATATSHGDSVLFAVAAFLLLVDLLERASLRRLGRAALLLPLLLVGIRENGRRLAWVMLGMMLLIAWLAGPARAWKRRLAQGVLVALPVLALYVAVGWGRGGVLFAPVQTLRSVTDTSYDHSAYWREVENWNIAVSIREAPILGIGLGGRYVEHMFNDDISSVYPEYREWPHNTILGQLLLLGLVGFAATWSLWAAGLYLAFRAYRHAVDPEHRVAAMACVGATVACHVLAYGDTGAHYMQYKVFAALSLALSGKLAVVTGAWPARAGAQARGTDTGAAPPTPGVAGSRDWR